MTHWWLDGSPAEALPIGDRGLQYGDGVFETLRVCGGRPRHLDRHLSRLDAGLRRLSIRFDAWDSLRAEIAAACASMPEAALKVIVTRGQGGRGYSPPEDTVPARIVGLSALPQRPGTCSVRVCDLRLARQPALAGIKHLNRLEQVIARTEWRDMSNWQEGLLLDDEGLVVCATQANVFALEDGALVTPALTACGIEGIIRGVVLEDAAPALGLDVHAGPMTLERLLRCDEVFLTNSLAGIWPVERVGDRAFDAPGPVTRRLREWIEHDDR